MKSGTAKLDRLTKGNKCARQISCACKTHRAATRAHAQQPTDTSDLLLLCIGAPPLELPPPPPRPRPSLPASVARGTKADPSYRAAAWPRQREPAPGPPRSCGPRCPLHLHHHRHHRQRSDRFQTLRPPLYPRAAAAGAEGASERCWRWERGQATPEERPRVDPSTLAPSGSCLAPPGSDVVQDVCGVALHRPSSVLRLCRPAGCHSGSTKQGDIVKPIIKTRANCLSYPILSYPILSYPIVSYPILSYPIVSYRIISCPILSCRILSCPVLFYPILSYRMLSYPILSYVHHPNAVLRTLLNSLFSLDENRDEILP